MCQPRDLAHLFGVRYQHHEHIVRHVPLADDPIGARWPEAEAWIVGCVAHHTTLQDGNQGKQDRTLEHRRYCLLDSDRTRARSLREWPQCRLDALLEFLSCVSRTREYADQNIARSCEARGMNAKVIPFNRHTRSPSIERGASRRDPRGRARHPARF